MRLAATLADIPLQLQQDLVRIQGRLEQISEAFQSQLLDRLHAGGYRRDAASARFNLGLDMLMGKVEREDDARPFPQKPHAFYLPDMPYQPFYPSEELSWVKEVEASTDAIEAELTAFLASRSQAFAPYIHGGLELPGQTSDTLKDHDNWTAGFLIRDGVEDSEWSASCPTVSALMETLPLTAIKGFSPSVLFSKLKPGARIDPHTGLLNCRLICHLPLVVPTGCGLRVGDERRNVVRGEVWAFDDSINHEAWNDSADDRIVLIFDVWHPVLTEQERRDITSLLEAVSA
jgi:aspartyl/asparaginyl beta-hydroxylase (cupin superfamily)